MHHRTHPDEPYLTAQEEMEEHYAAQGIEQRCELCGVPLWVGPSIDGICDSCLEEEGPYHG